MKNWWAVIATRIDQQMKGWNAPKGQISLATITKSHRWAKSVLHVSSEGAKAWV